MAYVPGMPTNIPDQAKKKAEEAYKKQQEEKKSSSSSSSVPGLPSNVPKDVQQKAQETYNAQQDIKTSTSISVPGLPSNLPTQVKKQAQKIYNAQQANAAYLNSLPSQPTMFTPDASKILASTNTYALANNLMNPGATMRSMVTSDITPKTLYEVIPTADRQKIRNAYTNMTDEQRKKASSFYSKVCSAISAQEAEYQQRTLNEMVASNFWSAGETQLVTGTTSQDYYKMLKNGYELVYVEDGCGKLANKGGVFSIGRDKLSGLPHDIRVVLVDHEGNWKYLADTGNKANQVEAIRIQQEALNARIEPKINEALIRQNFAQYKCDELSKRIKLYDSVANKTRKQEDIDALQSAIEEYNKWYQTANTARDDLFNLSTAWATWYDIYDRQVNNITKWTVEDEAHYQQVKEAVERADKLGINKNIRSNIHDSNVANMLASDTQLLTEYLELTKRRDAAAGSTAFLDLDTINYMDKTADSMKKAIDAYNKWDSVTIHMEDGEDLGQQIKRLMFLELGYDSGNLDVDPGQLIRHPIETLGLSNISRAIKDEEYREEFVDILKGIGSSTYKYVSPIIVGRQEWSRGKEAILASNARINSGNLSPEEIAAERLKIQDYLTAQQHAISQSKSILFNNAVSNLSIFDLASFQSAFVTWRMAKHPDRYSNDPKFKKLQDAYKAIYGEDYNGAMDAAHMARVMLDVKSGNAGDYIYVDGSDLRHSNGEKYGTAAAVAVGVLTDLSSIAGLSKLGAEAVVKAGGATALAKAATDSYVQALVRTGITQEAAEEFIKSKAIQKVITKDIKNAIKNTVQNGGDDVGKVINNILTDRAELLKGMYVDDIVKGLDEARYTKFLNSANEALAARADNIAKQVLFVEKGTVVASTLGGIDDTLDKIQRNLFKATCPVAGGVTAIARGTKYIKALKNLKNADPETLTKLAATQDSLIAKISKMNFDSCLDGRMLRKYQREVLNEFYSGVLGASKDSPMFNAVIRRFSKYSDGIMQGVANSYVSSVIKVFDNKLAGNATTNAIDLLEELAHSKKFSSFDEMFTTVKNNLEVMYAHSPDAKGIVDAFEKRYQRAALYHRIRNFNTYTRHIDDHIYVNSEFGHKYIHTLFTKTNVETSPELIQSYAHEVSDNIYNFLYATDPELMYLDGFATLHEAGVAAIDSLDKIAAGDLTEKSLNQAKAAMKDYVYDLTHTYKDNVKALRDNVMADAFGQQHYLDDIAKLAPDYTDNSVTIKSIESNIMKFFEDSNVQYTRADIDEILIKSDSVDDFKKLSMTEQQNLVYRIIANKGTNAINQITDDELTKVVSELTDCNSQLNKNISLFGESASLTDRLNFGISTALATENTGIVYNALKMDNASSDIIVGVMDVMSGKSDTINRIVQLNPSDVAAAKATDYIVDELKKQFALHNGTYRTFRELGGDTVDVQANVLNIEKNLIDNIPEDENYIDICVSMVKSTDNAAPKDIAFHMRGSADDPLVFRKNTRFEAYDSEFTSRTYGKTAQQLTDEYAALGELDTLSSVEWQNSIKNTIEQYKQMALEQNKTIRFVGFNSSDAISGGNRYLSDVLRSCGVNANTATAVDLADVLRKQAGEYVFDSADINSLRRGLQDAINNASGKSISLGISPTIAYDSKYSCTEIISNALNKHTFKNNIYAEHSKYVTDAFESINSRLGTAAYNEVGDALGAYIDAGAFARKLEDAGLSTAHANGTLMKIITEATTKGESQLSLNRIIDTALDNEWLDYSKVAAEDIESFVVKERVHDAVLQMNNIYNSMHRLDIFTDDDKSNLLTIYKELITHVPENSTNATIVRLIKAEELTVQQLYAVDKWVINQLNNTLKYKDFKEMFGNLMASYGKQTSYLSETGYRFIRDNIVDYTDDPLEAFVTKYIGGLDTDEGYRFAQSLRDIDTFKECNGNLKNYNEAVNGLFKEYNVHGEHDKALLMQLAAVHDPIIKFQEDIVAKYKYEYKAAYKSLKDEATKLYGVQYSREMLHRTATNSAIASTKEYIQAAGEKIRSASVQAVVDLDADTLKAHLIRNCCGGLIIDPTAKCVKGIDFTLVLEQWRAYGLKVDTIDFSNGAIKNRKLIRVSVPELTGANMDEVFAKYNTANVQLLNKNSGKFNNGMRHASFDASDMTLVNADHIDNFRELFFKDGGGTILDLNANFRSWRNELYSCNMWTDADLKRLVNPYYTDNALSNLAQNTHQLRNNISAVHDLGSIMNNRYMNTEYILKKSGVLENTTRTPIHEQRNKILHQITEQKQRACKVVVDKNNKIKLIDYTDRLKKASTSDKFFEDILKNTVLIDESFYAEVADWAKSTTVALRLQASNAPEWLTNAYQIYKKTIRNATITMYLYGNIGTAVRNYVDSSTKGLFETLQYGESATEYINKYVNAVKKVNEYSNIYCEIEDNFGRVNRETVAKYFDGDIEGLNKFNVIYGYEHTCGGDSLVRDSALKDIRADKTKELAEALNIDSDSADIIRKEFDKVYSSPKYYGLTNAQLETHLVEIHDKCMDAVRNNNKLNNIDFDALSRKFYNYEPTVVSWGDKLSQFPVLSFNKGRFNNAEVRARLAVYETFLEGGAGEAEAMKHVTATQFNYAGIGKVEDFMPFTQYKLYNALYWFDNANAHAVATAWRTAQYNGDGYMTNAEIAEMVTKYRTREYYLYEQGADAEYDEYYNKNLSMVEHIFLDGVDSYLGVPREFGSGNLDLNGTHYLKLGNSLVEEIDMVTTFAIGAIMLTSTIGSNVQMGSDASEKLRYAYESFKYTPLYDSLYSPWKSYIDLIQYSYDKNRTGELTSKNIWDNYKDFMANKSTHSEAIAALPVVGAILSNLVGRLKSFDLNLGSMAALMLDPDTKKEMHTFLADFMLDAAGAIIPSLVGTKVEPEERYNTYGANITKNFLVANPTTYFDMLGRLQKMGFSPEESQEIWDSMKVEWSGGSFNSKEDYYRIAKDLFAKGYTTTEIANLFSQHNLPELNDKRFLALYNALPGYIKYDSDMRAQIIDYYKAMGMTTDEAWAYLLNHPVIFDHGRLIELSPSDVARLNKKQSDAYWALHANNLTDEEWDAYWASMPYRYPKGKWSETYHYLIDAGYDKEAARAMLLHGYMLDANGRLVDVQGQVRAKVFHDYSHPLGYDNFNTYYQTLPNYIKYEKGAFSRTYQALKSLGFDYETSLKLIQQGAYLMDATMVPALMQTLGAKRERANEFIPVTDITSLLLKYGGRIIKGADGKDYMLIDCSGLQRPRKTYNYSGGGYSRRQWYNYGGRSSYNRYPWVNYPKYKKKPKYSQYYTRKPFVQQGNVSSFSGFTGYRGKTPDKLTKPYTTKGYVSTYSLQNFLNGASYGMRKAYKIDMRQFKTGALSIKSSYPASYRNIAVAYRRNLYKDLYAKYGMSRMRMRSNQAGYSNAAITRLRRNEIYNRERYAERRDRKAQEKVKLRATR